MIFYLAKVFLILTIFLIFYHVVLEREKMHQFNRSFLLCILPFSFITPFYKISTFTKPVIENLKSSDLISVLISGEIIQEDNFNLLNLIGIIYGIITSILITRFFKHIYDITLKISKNKKVEIQNATIILVDNKISPHTFWKYIFINKKAYENNQIEEELLTHELIHVTQRHSFDIIVIELLHVLFWFNPLFIFLKKAIKLNHEFIADNKVIALHKNITKYQYLLLDNAAWKNKYYLASNLNYVLTKKRLLMMTKQSSPRKITLKKLAVIPVLTGIIFLFAKKIEAQKIIKDNTETNESNYSTKDSLPSITTTGFHQKNNDKYYYVKNEKGITYYNNLGQKVSKEGKIIDQKRTESDKVLPNTNIKKVYQNSELVTEFKSNQTTNTFPIIRKGDITNIPPPPPTTKSLKSPLVKKGTISIIPPPPKKAIDFIKHNKYAVFFYNNQKVNYAKIISLVKGKKRINILTQNIGGKKIIRFTTKNKLLTTKSSK